MGVKNISFAFLKSNLACRWRTGRQAKLLFSAILLLAFFSVSGAVLSQGRNIPKSFVSNEENSANQDASMQVSKENKMGFADFLTIYHSYSKTKIEDERLKERGQEFQKEIDLDRDRIVELEKRMNSGILSETEKENLSKEVEGLKTQITKNIQEFNLKIDSERRQTIDRLIEDLRGRISSYGKEKGYVMIFDKNELVFSDTRLELTQEIVDYINKNSNE